MTHSQHPIVGDRVIEGEGTPLQEWQQWLALQCFPSLPIDELEPTQRICIFAPHPDDEVLGAAGLLQHLAERGHSICVVHVTSGTQSHPDSRLYSPERLAQVRPQESQKAFHALGIASQVEQHFFGLEDGSLYQQQRRLKQYVARFLRHDDVIIAPFAFDGHPDHEATGQVLQAYADQQGLRCWQVLIWAWHWAKPNDPRIPWEKVHAVTLNADQQQLKRQAIHCFQSQIEIDPSTGAPPILSAATIERILQPLELYIQHGFSPS